jgi:hypothetical protein
MRAPVVRFSEARTSLQPVLQIVPCELLRILIKPRLSDSSRWKALHGFSNLAWDHFDYIGIGFALDHDRRPLGSGCMCFDQKARMTRTPNNASEYFYPPLVLLLIFLFWNRIRSPMNQVFVPARKSYSGDLWT